MGGVDTENLADDGRRASQVLAVLEADGQWQVREADRALDDAGDLDPALSGSNCWLAYLDSR